MSNESLTRSGESHDLGPADAPADARPQASPPGYELLGVVGEGGMGVVYRARDIELNREVAVKLLHARYRPGSVTAARFLEEAQITSQLQHPGIPAVYRVGTLPGGQPYMAMKLIRGDTLHALLRAGAAMDPLAVFEAVAQAVGYAHAHGVVHRDLKPQNVMVGAFAEVQVMDWGLAKVLGSKLPDYADGDPEVTAGVTTSRDSETPVTQHGCVLGTPAYMPPEQAAGELEKIDARSDVFGLGAILCVLLTGEPPFAGRNAVSVRLNAVRGKTDEAFARLDACAADPGVVALCRRCLAFEPADRPASADEVASAVAELRRAASDRAKLAERGQLAAELHAAESGARWRSTVRAAAAVAAVLLLGLAGTTLGMVRAVAARADAVAAEARTEEKRVEAEAAQARAEAKGAEAHAILKFIRDRVFAAARPKGQEGGLGHNITLRDAIAASLGFLEADFTALPLLEADLRVILGRTFWYLGDLPAATRQAEIALAIHERHHPADHPDRLASLGDLATCYADTGRHEEALKLRKQVYDACRRTQHPDFLVSANNLAISYAALDRHEEALALREETLAGYRRRQPPNPDDALLVGSMHSLAVSYNEAGRHADALALQAEVLAARRRVLPPDHPDTLLSLNNLAVSHAELGRHAEALTLQLEALAGRRRALGPDHADTLQSAWGVAMSYDKCGRGAEAVAVTDECVARFASNPAHVTPLRGLVTLRLRHFEKAGDAAGCRASAALWESLGSPDASVHYDACCWRAVAATLYAKAGDAAEASADADRAMASLKRAVAAGYKDRTHVLDDTDLDLLRRRPDFRAIFASLPNSAEDAPPPRPAR